jgi:hypothetical protein
MEDGEVVDGAEHEPPSQADGPDRQDPPRQRSLSASAGAASIGAEAKVGMPWHGTEEKMEEISRQLGLGIWKGRV